MRLPWSVHTNDAVLADLADGRGYRESLSEPDRRHLDSCIRCQHLLEGHRRAAALLSRPGLSQPLPAVSPSQFGVTQIGAVSIAAVVVLALALAWRGSPNSTGTISPLITFGPSPTSSLANASPSATGAPESIDATAFDRLAWSPDGSRLAVVSPEAGVQILSSDGTLISTLSAPGFNIGWADPGHLVVDGTDPSLAPNPQSEQARIYSASGQLLETLEGRYLDVLGSGHGAAALVVAPADPTTAASRYAIWRDGTIGASASGSPLSWSHDGAMLVVLHPSTSPNTGSSRTGTAEIMQLDGKNHALAAAQVVVGIDPVFSPDDHYVAVCADAPPSAACQVEIADLATDKVRVLPASADTSLAWMSDGRLAFSSNGRLMFGTATGQVRDGGSNADWVRGASNGSVAAGIDQGSEILVISGTGQTSVQLPGPLGFGPFWSPDGHVLALAYSEPGGLRQQLVLAAAGP
jgi:hypothetical protein